MRDRKMFFQATWVHTPQVSSLTLKMATSSAKSTSSQDTPGSIAGARHLPKAEGTSRDLRLVLFDASLEEWLRPEAAWGMETYTAPGW